MANREDHETEQLLQIFPNEVWGMILEKVKDAQDFQNINNATSHFREFLLPRAPQMLFPEVVKVLLEQLPTTMEKEEESDDDHDEDWQGESENSTSSAASRKSGTAIRLNVLRLRQVCRASRISVDRWLQAQEFYSKSKYETDWPTFSMGYTKNFDYFSARGVRQFFNFEERFDPTHFDLPNVQTLNPFLSRGICLNISTFTRHIQLPLEPPDLDLFYNACIQLLRKYGHHLWYCQIEQNIRESQDETEFFTHWLPRLLELMPNLRTLFVDGHVDHKHRIRLRNDDQRPFPPLAQLNTILVDRVPRLVVKALLQSNPQVQQVDVQTPVCGNKELRLVESTKYCLELLPNLTAAAFQVSNEEAFKRFRSARVAGRVERLWLDTSDLMETPWQRIFRAVEFQFSDTLTELCIRLPDGNKKQKIYQGLTLPNLKILKLILYDVEPLDYLLPMKQTLEQLSVEYRVEEGDQRFDNGVAIQNEEKAVLKLYRFWSEPVRSTIWTNFPRLKRLETARTGEVTDHYVCTREQ